MLRKSSALARQVSKWKLRATRTKVRKSLKAERDRAWDAKRREIYDLDKGRCRAFRVPTRFVLSKADRRGDPRKWAACHHVIYRSAGGADTNDNLANVSQEAHSMIHGTHGTYDLDCSGDANVSLHFVLKDAKTGDVIKAWDSVR